MSNRPTWRHSAVPWLPTPIPGTKLPKRSHITVQAHFFRHRLLACTLDPAKVEALITSSTRAILVGNTNGHPAAWDAFWELAKRHGLLLIEDSTEVIRSCSHKKSL